jgi:hypothetical protein
MKDICKSKGEVTTNEELDTKVKQEIKLVNFTGMLGLTCRTPTVIGLDCCGVPTIRC